jgi:pimeloyl-ACP methyl ester carboxylesterase
LRGRGHDTSGPFTLGRKLVGLAAQGIDRAVVSAVHLRSARREATHGDLTTEKKLQWLLKAADDYAPALEGPDDVFFVRPDAVNVTTERVARLRGRLADDAAGTFDLAWPSDLPAWLPEMRDPLRVRRENLTGRARVFRGGLGRPVVVCLHGYLGGNYAIEELKFPTEFFFQNGIDVALPVLPHHGGRGSRGKGPPPFPSVDPALTNEGFRQAIYDLRVLVAHLRAEGAPWIGVVGTSLGGHTVTLLATLEDDLAFVVPVVPLASVADFARDHGELGQGSESERLFHAFERANAVVSPYSRPSRVPSARTFVIGAEGDAITGVAHAERIARHLDARVAVTPGGHLLQLWRGALTRGLAPILAELPHR